MKNQLHTAPDEHLEARITAWVLGEASPFEAAELEALCAEDPELQVFVNRTKALHSLLLETPPSASDQFWKLSPERRAKLDDIIGPNVPSQSGKDSRIRRAAFRTAFSIAAVLTITLFIKRFIFISPPMMKESQMTIAYSMELDESELDGLQSAKNERGERLSESEKSLADNSRQKGMSPSRGNFADEALERSMKKPSAPSSSIVAMPQAKTSIASLSSEKKSSASGVRHASPSAREIPVPNVDTTTPSMNFGKGEDFGSGWGGGGGYADKEGKKDMSNTAFALSAVTDGVDFASNESLNKGESLYEEKSREGEARFSDGKELTESPTSGLRSGDYAIARESIDAILNNSNGTATAENGLAQNLRKDRKNEKARELFKQDKLSAPTDSKLNEELAQLDDSIRTNPALTFEQDGRIDEVRRKLNLAEGKLELGKYDDAKEAYKDTLRIDPSNSAARRVMEKAANAKSDYYRAAYDHTRANLLMQVDKAWELAVPAEDSPSTDPFAAPDVSPPGNEIADSNFDGFVDSGAPIAGEPSGVKTTTKFTEITQANQDELGFGWAVKDEGLKAKIQAEDILDAQKGLEHEILAGTTSEYFFRGTQLAGDSLEGEKAPILGDTPITGRLFKAKPPSLTDLSNEISASEEVYSTFSLNISDASFQIASAAVEKGERPDPTAIKPEQFYNAVDYGDPAPSSSEPVAAAIDQTAHPVIPGRNLVRVALRTASTGRSEAQPLRLTLLVDQSGSMVRNDRRIAMETALTQLATLLTENDQITVIGFSRTPHLLVDSLPGNEAAKLPQIINQSASEGGTNLEQAIKLATELALRHQLNGAQNRIVLFTDGAANLGDANPESLSEKIENLRQQGLAFDIAGIGTNDINDRLLSDLARHGNGRYYLVGEKTGANFATQLAGAFRPAAENVKVQVKLNPQRVGNYKLIGFEKDRLKTEDFRNDTVDAAELAADEAGVALYQVETLPQGTGEIGEISVRFRDTASGEMVERKWTIPYDASTPSFDKANPKTQLATLALLAAQKLQNGPMADAIDFSNFSKTIAELKQANAKSEKTQQLLNLINALK
jgi:Mg-chelatase subunit ChlD/Tfp pilus assembly protein PilF